MRRQRASQPIQSMSRRECYEFLLAFIRIRPWEKNEYRKKVTNLDPPIGWIGFGLRGPMGCGMRESASR
jgi:hypothetical protein